MIAEAIDTVITLGWALLAWIIWNFLLTRPFPKVAAAAITGSSLRDGLWSELSKWRDRSPLLLGTFDWQTDRITHRQHPDRWWCSARTWNKAADAEQQGMTLAGLHEDYILAVLDESGGMPRAVMAAAEAVLANVGTPNGGKEAHILQSGNPTHLMGFCLYEACVTDRRDWRVLEMTGDPDDPKRCERQSKSWAQDFIRKYGRDHPWTCAKVLGRFPKRSDAYLIAIDDFEAAYGLERPDFVRDPRIMGVDVARSSDDCVIAFREGDYLIDIDEWPGKAITYSTGRVREAAERFKPSEIRIDDIGVGGGLTDNLLAFGLPVVAVNVGESSPEPQYALLRSYLNVKVMRDDRFRAGMISIAPHLRESRLMSEATGIMVDYAGIGDKVQVESKKKYRARMDGRSPDRWDAVVLAFAKLAGGPLHALAAIRALAEKAKKSPEMPERPRARTAL